MKKTVAIIGLGPSLASYVNAAKILGGTDALAGEIWTINALGDVLRADRIFHMDDLAIQEIRAAARPESNIARMIGWMRQARGVPIYTSRMRDGYPDLVEYPAEDVANDIGMIYFNNTAAWAVALAIHEKFEKIVLFGCDFTYPNAHDAERGRACVEFLLGFAHGRGIELSIPRGTSLLDGTEPYEARMYGFNGSVVKIGSAPGKKFTFEISDRESLPSADEIEAEYDHKAHPNSLVESAEEG